MFLKFFAKEIGTTAGFSWSPESECQTLNITQATLGPLAKVGESSSLQVVVSDDKFLLCTLTPGKNANIVLDLIFSEGIEFIVKGSGASTVHISGYIVTSTPEDQGHATNDHCGDSECQDTSCGPSNIDHDSEITSQSSSDIDSEDQIEENPMHKRVKTSVRDALTKIEEEAFNGNFSDDFSNNDDVLNLSASSDESEDDLDDPELGSEMFDSEVDPEVFGDLESDDFETMDEESGEEEEQEDEDSDYEEITEEDNSAKLYNATMTQLANNGIYTRPEKSNCRSKKNKLTNQLRLMEEADKEIDSE